MREEVKVFAEAMDKILDEKFPKYQNSWKEVDLYKLKDCLNEQFDKLIISDDNIKDSLRTIPHLGNYLMFLYYRLNELNR